MARSIPELPALVWGIGLACLLPELVLSGADLGLWGTAQWRGYAIGYGGFWPGLFGALLYSRYLFLFESAGLILLVAMIGAIVLTHRERKDTRGQNIARQNSRRPEDATVNVKPEVGKGVQL